MALYVYHVPSFNVTPVTFNITIKFYNEAMMEINMHLKVIFCFQVIVYLNSPVVKDVTTLMSLLDPKVVNSISAKGTSKLKVTKTQMHTGAPSLLAETAKHSPSDKTPLPISFSVLTVSHLKPTGFIHNAKLPPSHKHKKLFFLDNLYDGHHCVSF